MNRTAGLCGGRGSPGCGAGGANSGIVDGTGGGFIAFVRVLGWSSGPRSGQGPLTAIFPHYGRYRDGHEVIMRFIILPNFCFIFT